MRDSKSNNDGKEENDYKLVLRNIIVKNPTGFFRFNDDSDKLYLFCCKYLSGQPSQWKMAFGDMYMYAINTCMFTWFRII